MNNFTFCSKKWKKHTREYQKFNGKVFKRMKSESSKIEETCWLVVKAFGRIDKFRGWSCVRAIRKTPSLTKVNRCALNDFIVFVRQYRFFCQCCTTCLENFEMFLVVCSQNTVMWFFRGKFVNMPRRFEKFLGIWLWWWFFVKRKVGDSWRYIFSRGVTKVTSNCLAEFRSNHGRTIVTSSNPL